VHAAAAAVMLADMKLGRIRLVGFTDRTGSAARNQALAEERARAVADFLVAQGVPAPLIETAGIIDGALPVPTEAGVPEPLNRSVSIVAVPVPTT
jgi:outer membrane protein OmpA-like peptidoglycan-associated protein